MADPSITSAGVLLNKKKKIRILITGTEFNDPTVTIKDDNHKWKCDVEKKHNTKTRIVVVVTFDGEIKPKKDKGTDEVVITVTNTGGGTPAEKKLPTTVIEEEHPT